MMRLFLAIEINADVRMRLAETISELKSTGSRVAWVAPGNIHLTLLFLGNVPTATIPSIQTTMDQVAPGHGGFVMRIAGIGFFGSPRSPRVLWAGVPAAPQVLLALQRDLDHAIRSLDLSLKDQGYTPHLTLGRVRGPPNIAMLVERLPAFQDTAFGDVPVSRVVLMRSVLEPQGVRYPVLHRTDL